MCFEENARFFCNLCCSMKTILGFIFMNVVIIVVKSLFNLIQYLFLTFITWFKQGENFSLEKINNLRIIFVH